MKKTTAIVALILLLATVLTACGGGNGTTTTASTTTSGEGGTTVPVTTAEPEPAGYLNIVENGEYLFKVVVPDRATSTQTTYITNFVNFVKNKAKLSGKMETVKESTAPSGKEIVICCTKNRPAAEAAMLETSYAGFDIRIVDGNIIISAYGEKQLKNAFGYLEEKFKFLDEEKTVLAIPADYAYSSTGAGTSGTIPVFIPEEGNLRGGTYSCGNGLYLLSYEKIKSAEFSAYGKLLKSLGFTLYKRVNTIGRDNTFSTYVNKDTDTTVHLAYYTSKKVMTISYGPSTLYLPVDQKTYTKTNEVTIAQPGRQGAHESAPGMGFIMQLEDGRYILMDGGNAAANDVTAFYNYMVEHKPASHAKPQIAMWIISHMDGDHTGLATSFMNRYKNDVELETIAFNAPDFANMTMAYYDTSAGVAVVNQLLAYARGINPKVNYWKFHTGETITLGGVTMEILFTHEEMYPNAMPYGNHHCSAWRFDIHGTKAVFLGDCETQLNQWMADVFGTELECDILQASHHGFNGAVNAIYEKTNPKVVLWPVDYERWSTDTRCIGTAGGYAFNAILRSQPWTRSGGATGKRQHFATSTTTIITFDQFGGYTINRASD